MMILSEWPLVGDVVKGLEGKDDSHPLSIGFANPLPTIALSGTQPAIYLDNSDSTQQSDRGIHWSMTGGFVDGRHSAVGKACRNLHPPA